MIHAAKNPFLSSYGTPFETPPFDKIKTEHYEPAFEEAIKQHTAEIQKITTNKEVATFSNTIEALERSGKLLSNVSSVFFNLLSAESNEEMQEISQRISPKLSEHSNNIYLNEKLFDRVRDVYMKKDMLDLSIEQERLLDEMYDLFVNKGVNLPDEKKSKYRELSAELSRLTLSFSQNVLKETNAYQLHITDINKLKGLPQSQIEAAGEKAKQKGHASGWVFDLTAPSYVPFMKYIEDRDLRKELYVAYNTRCIQGGETDNRKIVEKIVNLRMEIAQLMGYNNYAQYILRKRMANSEEKVYNLLNNLLEAYKPEANDNYTNVKQYANSLEPDFGEVMPWDWAFYSDKLKNELFDINDELLKPYFELGKVKRGVFRLANELYGLLFTQNNEIPTYHPEVEAYEVYDNDGKFLSVLYLDFHPREGKRAGAWMTTFKEQYKENGIDSRPQVSMVMNFSRPTDSLPALLTFDEVLTLLHEFGHALHGMMADGTYESLSGTNVYWDFVELPSQLMENWGNEKAFLDQFARHYITDELIPAELVEKLKNAENFNVGYNCLRQLSFGFLDMSWYTLTTPFSGDVLQFEREAWKDTNVLPVVQGTCMSTQFNHIFSGGYAAGYYSYKWAEVLEADAFSVFKANGIFNKTIADSFRKNILSKGNTEDPMSLYINFRGSEPAIDALLVKDGIYKRNLDKALIEYEKTIDTYLDLIEDIKNERNQKIRNQKMQELTNLTPEIQKITKRISELSVNFTPEHTETLEAISKKMNNSVIP